METYHTGREGTSAQEGIERKEVYFLAYFATYFREYSKGYCYYILIYYGTKF